MGLGGFIAGKIAARIVEKAADNIAEKVYEKQIADGTYKPRPTLEERLVENPGFKLLIKQTDFSYKPKFVVLNEKEEQVYKIKTTYSFSGKGIMRLYDNMGNVVGEVEYERMIIPSFKYSSTYSLRCRDEKLGEVYKKTSFKIIYESGYNDWIMDTTSEDAKYHIYDSKQNVIARIYDIYKGSFKFLYEYYDSANKIKGLLWVITEILTDYEEKDRR